MESKVKPEQTESNLSSVEGVLPIFNYVRPTTSKRKKIWDFVNSSLFIWFLSSVAVVAVSNWYSNRQISIQLDTKRVQTIQRLNSEISYRIFYAVRFLELRKIDLSDSISSEEIYKRTYNILDNSTFVTSLGGINYSVYTEYFQRPFSSLLFELKEIDTSSAYEVKKAFEGFNRLDNFTSLRKYRSYELRQAVDTCLHVINNQILTDKWKKMFLGSPSRLE